MCLAKDCCSVAWKVELESGFQKHIQKIMVLMEMKAEKTCVNVLEVDERSEAMKKSCFDLPQCHHEETGLSAFALN